MLMQPFDVYRVEGVLHDLQPIAGDHRRADVAQHAVAHEQFPARQKRRGLWTEVSENQPAKFFDWIRRHANAIFECAIGIFGLLFHNQIEDGARDLYLIGSALIVFSFVMLAAERVATQRRDIEELDSTDAWTMGFAQALALVPGVSRSGSTISAGLFSGLTRTAAARYSFLLSVPAVVLSGLFELRKVGDGTGAAAAPTAIATLLAFVVGYASIALLLRFLVRHSIGWFAAYRLVLGVLVIALAANGAIS